MKMTELIPLEVYPFTLSDQIVNVLAKSCSNKASLEPKVFFCIIICVTVIKESCFTLFHYTQINKLETFAST